MFGMSMTEVIIIAVFALLVLGPKELPNVARTVGKTLRDVRKAGDDLKETIEREIMQEKPTPRIRPVAEAVAKIDPAAEAAPGDAKPPESVPNLETAHVAPAEAPAPAAAPEAALVTPVDPSAKV